MKKTEFLKRIKAKAERNRLNREDVRFRKTIAFLKGKGLLDTNLPIAAATGIKLDINDALWAGIHVEPRILEVLPTAILNYQKSFLGVDRIPEKFADVLRAIRNNVDDGPDYEGALFEKMKYWANLQLRDGRTKPIGEKKVAKYLKLSTKNIRKLERLVADGAFKDQTSAIEAAIEKL